MTDVWHRPAWYDHAACQGMPLDLFFHEHNESAAGKAVCQRCPVQAECLEHALEHHERHGLFGGASVKERERMLRRRRAT